MTFATRALTAAEVLRLTCLSQKPPTIEVPRELPPTPVSVPVAIDVALTNHNPPGACAPITFQLKTLSSAGVDLVVEHDRDVGVVRAAPADAIGDPVEPAEDLGGVCGGVVGAVRLAVPVASSWTRAGASSAGMWRHVNTRTA